MAKLSLLPDPDDFADLFPPDPPASGLTDDDLRALWADARTRGPFARGEAMLLMEREIEASHADALAYFRELLALEYGPAAPTWHGTMPDPATEDGDDAPPDD